MLSEIEAALKAIAGSFVPLGGAKGAGRAFELFVMAKLAERLAVKGWQVELQDSDGKVLPPSQPFLQRGGAPGPVPPPIAGGPSTIRFQGPSGGAAWELWNGVQFRGRSGALHELDLAVVPEELGKALRASGGGYPFGRPRVAVECKDVASAGSQDEMRTFVSRLYDLTLLEGHRHFLGVRAVFAIYAKSPRGGGFEPAAWSYRSENGRTLNVLARRGGFSEGAGSMTGYYCIRPYGSLTAASASPFIEEVADWIVMFLQ